MGKSLNQNGRNGIRRALEKRLKELHCLYDVARITGLSDITLGERLAELVKIIPRAFQYPESVYARIYLYEDEFKSELYRNTPHKIAAEITVRGVKAGAVEIGCIAPLPCPEDALFSKEERLLLNAIAERVGSITAHRQVEDALQESEEKFSKAFQSSPVVITIAGLETGRLLEVNDNFIELTGYTREEALKLSTIDTGIWSNAEERNLVFRDLKLKGKIRNVEIVIHDRKGDIHHGLLSADMINIGGRPFVLTVIIDVTERKFLERKVIEIEEVNKTKNDLLAIVSHELRTPLTSIKGYATMILDHFSRLSSEETKETVRSIDSSADRLAKLIDNLLDTTRIGAGLLTLKKSAEDISDLVEAAVEEASLLSRNHHIIIKLGKSLPIVYIDVKRIRQVLDNLLDNAVKYSPAGAVTTVSVRKLKNELLISVADQGRGIPGGELTRVFERMYKIEQRLQEGNQGIGLGLHVCQRLVEAHGGRIWAESVMGKGSTLKFTLPITGDPANWRQQTLIEKTDKTPVGHRK
jgi:PAS domain S-box-containing protein